MSPVHPMHPDAHVNPGSPAEWRDDIDALRFATGEAERDCFMHRLAFRRFLGLAPSGADCIDFFEANRPAFLAAAATKGVSLPGGVNFNINSRDLARAISALTDRPAG